MYVSQRDPQGRAHSIEWLSTPCISGGRKGRTEIQRLNGFLRFQSQLNAELLRHPALTDNTLLDHLEGDSYSAGELAYLLQQLAIFCQQLMLSRQQHVLDLIERNRFEEEGAYYTHTLTFAIVYDHAAQPQLHRPHDKPLEPAALLFEIAELQAEWFTDWQAALPSSLPLTTSLAQAAPATRDLCLCIDRDYTHPDATIALATMFTLESALSNDLWERLRRSLIRASRRLNLQAPTPNLLYLHEQMTRAEAQYAELLLEQYWFNHDTDTESFLVAGLQLLDRLHQYWQSLR